MSVLTRPPVYETPPMDFLLPVDGLSGRHARGVSRAIAVAATSAHRFPMAAVAMRGGTLIGASTNRFRNHPRVVDHWVDCSVHAEQALVSARELGGSVVYVARLDKSGRPALAKPCRACWSALTEANVRQVFWTTDSDLIAGSSLGDVSYW